MPSHIAIRAFGFGLKSRKYNVRRVTFTNMALMAYIQIAMREC